MLLCGVYADVIQEFGCSDSANLIIDVITVSVVKVTDNGHATVNIHAEYI